MNSDRKIVYIFSSVLLLILSLLLFYSYNYLNIIIAIILAIGTLIVNKFIKKRLGLSIYKKEVLLIVAISSVTFLMGYYLLGIEFGFKKTANPISVYSVFNYLLPITITIFSFEYIRYALISYKSKLVNVLVYISSVVLEILLVSSLTQISKFNQFMDIVALTFIPAIVSNVLYDYLGNRYGVVPNIVYRSITTLYLYIIPFVPDVPESLFALMKLFVPLLILFIVKLLYEKKEKVALKRNDAWSSVIYGVVFVFVLAVTMVFSNQFAYGAVVIATESMTGELNKGDIVFYKQYDGEEIKEQEIILFTENDVLVVHRVVEVENIDGETRYYTKGDYNLDRDSGYRLEKDVVGKTTIKCPYVGHVTLWLNEMFNK